MVEDSAGRTRPLRANSRPAKNGQNPIFARLGPGLTGHIRNRVVREVCNHGVLRGARIPTIPFWRVPNNVRDDDNKKGSDYPYSPWLDAR